MDAVFKEALSTSFSSFRAAHFDAPAGKSPVSLQFNTSNWEWAQLFSPMDFKFQPGTTPMADFGLIRYAWLGYFTTILSLKVLMMNREPMKLRMVTAIHNLILCVGSLGMFIAGAYGSYLVQQERGIGQVFWAPNSQDRQGLQYWALYVFYLSKYPELLDTVILVLKKKPVIFLHWYHHAVVLLMMWSWCQGDIGFGVVGLMFNTGVHVFMYWYYFASNMGWSVWYKKYITSLQIVQFIGSFLVTIPFVYYATKAGNFESWVSIRMSTFVNFTFLLLFVKFYLDSYKSKSSKKGAAKQKGASDAHDIKKSVPIEQ